MEQLYQVLESDFIYVLLWLSLDIFASSNATTILCEIRKLKLPLWDVSPKMVIGQLSFGFSEIENDSGYVNGLINELETRSG